MANSYWGGQTEVKPGSLLDVVIAVAVIAIWVISLKDTTRLPA